MTREYSRRNVDIWGDPDMRALPFPAQYLYNVLWDHPALSYCGVLDWRPGKWSQLAGGLTPELVRTFAACLQARHFIVVDEETEEVLLRSWVRFDGLMKQPRLAVSFVSAYADLGSNSLRGVVVDELAKLRQREPDLAGFKDKRVTEILGFPRVSARSLPTVADPFGDGVALGLDKGLGIGLGQIDPKVWVPPTPSPTPTPISNSKERGPRKRGTRITEDWMPDPEVKAKMLTERPGVDYRSEHQNFIDHFLAASGQNATKVDWNAAWRKWMRSARSPQSQQRSMGGTTPDRSYFTPPPPPEGMPSRMLKAWNLAWSRANREGQPGPADWHDLEAS